MDGTERRLIAWWMALVLATVASWEAGRAGSLYALPPTIVIVTLAFAKVTAVMMQFMEARTAPWLLKFCLSVWVIGVGSTVAILWLW